MMLNATILCGNFAGPKDSRVLFAIPGEFFEEDSMKKNLQDNAMNAKIAVNALTI